MQEVMIHIKDLTKIYKIYNKPLDRAKEALLPGKHKYGIEFHALNGVSFDVYKGDAVGILGKNGSGKSTLLKIVTGVLTPTAGGVHANGRISSILELGAGFNMEYTGIQNIYLNGTILGYSKQEIEKKMDSIIEFADIGDFIHQPVKIYSSGMFARLAFAVAISVQPDILIIDEVLAVGDTRFQIKCLDKMKELKEIGTTILFVSHATEQIKRFCNRAVWIKDGQLIMDGDSSRVVDIYDDYMKNGDQVLEKLNEIQEEIAEFDNETEFTVPENKEIVAAITKVKMNKKEFQTFDEFYVDVEYEIYQEKVEGFLLGVAIYSSARDYIFGPNTFLEKKEIPDTFGRHHVRYHIAELPILKGTFEIDVGIFSHESIVNIDYKQGAESFIITNEYFSEGTVYIKHNWEVYK